MSGQEKYSRRLRPAGEKRMVDMDYEELYRTLVETENDLKNSLAAAQKLYKNAVKESASGDLKALERDLGILSEAIAAQKEAVERLQAEVKGFDTKKYFESGAFETQLLQCCEQKGVDVTGESPVYEMFPYRIRIDMDNQDLYINRKKVACVRPQAFAETVKEAQDKLDKARFNAVGFAGELCDAYDLALLKSGKKAGSDVYLTSLYRLLAPMSRYRRDYDQNSYAFDLARLYISGQEETKNGRRFQFGSSRNINKAIRILDQDGKEQYLATICFYEAQ